MFRHNLHFAPQSVKAKAYLATVRPILEYGLVSWSPSSSQLIHQLEMRHTYVNATQGILIYLEHMVQEVNKTQARSNKQLYRMDGFCRNSWSSWAYPPCWHLDQVSLVPLVGPPHGVPQGVDMAVGCGGVGTRIRVHSVPIMVTLNGVLMGLIWY